jgi:nicotinamide-nucleotide amidase
MSEYQRVMDGCLKPRYLAQFWAREKWKSSDNAPSATLRDWQTAAIGQDRGAMRVEVINTGTELLLGHVLNTHLRDLSEMLFPLGLRVGRQVTVPDGDAIREAMAESFARAEIVLVTGGLGPTTDDLTREIAAELLGVELRHDEAIMEAIAKRFARRGLEITARVGKQAMRPAEATVLANQNGTAPGLYFPAGVAKAGVPHLFLLPGPPRELVPMVQDAVIPILEALLPPSELLMRSWRVIGLGESEVEKLVGEELIALQAELGYCARPGEVDVRVIGTEAQLVAAEIIVSARLGLHIAAHEERALEAVVIDLLRERRKTVATIESCTGGLLAHRLTNVPGASEVFLQGFVTYSNEAKSRAVGVDPQLIKQHGAVSHQVAVAMAIGGLAEAGATYALATTGIAGPGGGTAEKPVGTVYIALAEAGKKPVVQRHQFPTDRATFKDLVSQTALNLLRLRLLATDLPKA